MTNESNNMRHHGASGTGEILAGFLFFPIGLLAIIFGAIPVTYESLDVYRWVAVPAEIISVELTEKRGKDGDIYHRVTAQYRYQRHDRTYTSERLHSMGAHNQTDEWNRQIYTRLKKALDEGTPATSWCNPSSPSESVIERGFHWPMLLLFWFVPSIFCLIGYLGLRHVFSSAKAPGGNAPWLANSAWHDNTIHSDARPKVYLYLPVAIVLLIVSLLPLTATNGDTTREFRLIAAFPINLLVFAAIAAAIKATWQWWRYGASPLTLAPFPGAIGGDVAGEILFRVPYQRGIKAEVQLTAARKDESKDRESFDTTVEWQEDGYAQVTGKSGGIALQFRFAVPEGLPQSDLSYERRRYANRHYEWTLNVTVITPQEEIKRKYEIPVYPTAEQTTVIETDTLQENPFTSTLQAAHQILPAVQHQGEATLLKFPMRGITAGMRLMLWLGSVLFITALLILINSSFRETMGIAGIIIVIAALYLLGRIIYHHFNALRVQFTGNIVISERQLLGITLRSHFVSYYDIKDIVFQLAPRAKKGEFHQTEYVVYAVTDKANVMLAERIAGRRKAELVVEHLRQLIKLDERLAPA